MDRQPRTLLEAVKHFADFENCRAFMVDLRWPDGKVACPTCGSEHVVWLANARVWKCYGKHLKPKFSLKTGTIFEDSPLGLDKWLAAVWLVVNCKNGISSYEMARDLGVTQKSAWFMNHRIRLALHAGSFDKMSGHVEADETFIAARRATCPRIGRRSRAYRQRRRTFLFARIHTKGPRVGEVQILEEHKGDRTVKKFGTDPA